MKDCDIGVVRSSPCFVSASRTMVLSSTWRWSILNTLTVCLHIISSFAMGQLHCVYSESGAWMVQTFGMLFMDATYAIPSSMQINTLLFGILLALMIVDATMHFCFLLQTKPNALHWYLY